MEFEILIVRTSDLEVKKGLTKMLENFRNFYKILGKS